MLNIHELSVIYPDRTQAIDNLSLTIAGGESVALVGANGAGKTSLILAIMGLIPSTGNVTVDGVRLGKETVQDIRTRIGVVFQNPDDQLFMPTIYDDVAFGLRNQGLPEEEVRQRVLKCLSQLHIEHLSGKTALKLSGGEKRMATLATVLVMQPSIMILDEPSVFLDPKARRNLIGTLNALPQTKVIATHDLTFADETCDRCVLIKDGAVFADKASCDVLYDEALMDACGVEAIGANPNRRITL